MHDKVVAIHQPNLFPWLGYFDKINKSDIFILMDNVQFPKKGGTWTNRVRLAINGQPRWITVPIVRNYHGVRLIKDMEINNAIPWRTKMLKTIEFNYAKSLFFKEEWEYIQTLIHYDTQDLCDFNIQAIRSLTKHLGLDASKLIIGSTLKTEGRATELLLSMTNAVGGNTYICGGGANGYQEDGKFEEQGIRLLYQNFEHPIYSQSGNGFVSGLSILDVLFSCGKKTIKGFLDESKQEWLNRGYL